MIDLIFCNLLAIEGSLGSITHPRTLYRVDSDFHGIGNGSLVLLEKSILQSQRHLLPLAFSWKHLLYLHFTLVLRQDRCSYLGWILLICALHCLNPFLSLAVFLRCEQNFVTCWSIGFFSSSRMWLSFDLILLCFGFLGLFCLKISLHQQFEIAERHWMSFHRFAYLSRSYAICHLLQTQSFLTNSFSVARLHDSQLHPLSVFARSCQLGEGSAFMGLAELGGGCLMFWKSVTNFVYCWRNLIELE